MGEYEQQKHIKDLEQLLLTYGESKTATNDALVLLTFLRQQTESQEIIVNESLRRQRKLESIINDLREQMKNPGNLDVEFNFKKNGNKDADDDK